MRKSECGRGNAEGGSRNAEVGIFGKSEVGMRKSERIRAGGIRHSAWRSG